jgi:hypothetical protein
MHRYGWVYAAAVSMIVMVRGARAEIDADVSAETGYETNVAVIADSTLQDLPFFSLSAVPLVSFPLHSRLTVDCMMDLAVRYYPVAGHAVSAGPRARVSSPAGPGVVKLSASAGYYRCLPDPQEPFQPPEFTSVEAAVSFEAVKLRRMTAGYTFKSRFAPGLSLTDLRHGLTAGFSPVRTPSLYASIKAGAAHNSSSDTAGCYFEMNGSSRILWSVTDRISVLGYFFPVYRNYYHDTVVVYGVPQTANDKARRKIKGIAGRDTKTLSIMLAGSLSYELNDRLELALNEEVTVFEPGAGADSWVCNLLSLMLAWSLQRL